jgi:hypothetical protein
MKRQNANWGFVREIESWRYFSAIMATSLAAARQVSALEAEGSRMDFACHSCDG